MSIYPVSVAEWYPPGDDKHEIMKFLVRYGHGDSGGCPHCGKKRMHWQRAWAHHALPYSGYGEIWCSKKHLENYWKKQNDRRRIKKT